MTGPSAAWTTKIEEGRGVKILWLFYLLPIDVSP